MGSLTLVRASGEPTCQPVHARCRFNVPAPASSTTNTFNMTVQPLSTRFRATDPPGTREGSGETAHPPRQCPQATRTNSEISGSRGDRGPSPDYNQRDPPCASSIVALAGSVTGEERRPTSLHEQQRS